MINKIKSKVIFGYCYVIYNAGQISDRLTSLANDPDNFKARLS